MTRLKFSAALVAGFAFISIAAQAADEDPQWPNVPSESLPVPNPRPAFADPDEVVARILRKQPGDLDADEIKSAASGDPQWPDVPPEKLPAPDTNRPSPESQLAKTRILPSDPIFAADMTVRRAAGAARWPDLPPDRAPPSPFAFETGARYWFSGGKIRFAFANGAPLFGDPTSTLDWHGLTAHSGEVFARVDHRPSGFFVKGMYGLGAVTDGQIDDRDFLVGQIKFSDTTSDVKNGNLNYAMLDLGWAYQPMGGIRLSFFAGYHYWHEKVTAYGLLCNQASFVIATCPSAGAVPIGFDTAVLSYEPTWHALRVGTEARFAITDRWSFSAEIAAIPFAAQQNDDSHLLRTDLGPSPNVITQSRYAYGVEAEMFFNYAITPNIEIGGGVRYWGLVSRYGDVRFGPTFDIKNTLNNFDQERYGLLAQIKGRF